ncbi:hypothetical protein ABWI01_03280 [Oceanicaulis alexandrii]|uniref:hypothetical protein n=1 Tax=Oceanicaulis alexandrii TaxID=153233 RepID=UPI0035CEB77A
MADTDTNIIFITVRPQREIDTDRDGKPYFRTRPRFDFGNGDLFARTPTKFIFKIADDVKDMTFFDGEIEGETIEGIYISDPQGYQVELSRDKREVTITNTCCGPRRRTEYTVVCEYQGCIIVNDPGTDNGGTAGGSTGP